MNKTELLKHITETANISKASATLALDSTLEAIRNSLKENGTVSLVGFGTFSVGMRAERLSRNPRNGKVMEIKAAKVPKFKPGKGLKEAVN